MAEAAGADAPSLAGLRFEDFYARQLGSTLAVVIALRGPRISAEEVVQEAFLRAYDRWGRVGKMDRPDLWVQRVALNLASSRLRQVGAEVRALLRVGVPREEAVTDGYEDALAFWTLVGRLPRQQAHVVALHYAADRPIADIAEVLGIAEGTVKAHLHAARRRLASLLEQENDDA